MAFKGGRSCIYDGKRLFELIQQDKSPFHGVWDLKLLIQEIEENRDTKVTDIPVVNKGSNNYVRLWMLAHSFITKSSNTCPGLSPENIEQARHGSSHSSRGCQHAWL